MQINCVPNDHCHIKNSFNKKNFDINFFSDWPLSIKDQGSKHKICLGFHLAGLPRF